MNQRTSEIYLRTWSWFSLNPKLLIRVMSIHFQVKTAWFHSSKWNGAGKHLRTYWRGISSVGYQQKLLWWKITPYNRYSHTERKAGRAYGEDEKKLGKK